MFEFLDNIDNHVVDEEDDFRDDGEGWSASDGEESDRHSESEGMSPVLSEWIGETLQAT